MMTTLAGVEVGTHFLVVNARDPGLGVGGESVSIGTCQPA